MAQLIHESPEWLRLYLEEYWTLDEVGKFEGISREGVSNRLKRLGIEPRSLSETNRLRENYKISLHAEEIRKTFLKTLNIDETAGHVELPVPWVRRFVKKDIPNFEILTRAPRNASKRYSTDDLIGSLREAASSLSGNLTSVEYGAFIAAHGTLADGRPRPGAQVMALRYGSWRAALEAAGLPTNPQSAVQKEFNEAEAVAAVVACWRSHEHPPTAVGYDEWQRGYEGRPSMSTVRKLAGPWNSLLVRAWQVVHGITLDQDEPDIAVPEPLLANDVYTPAANVFITYYAANEGTEVSLRSDLVADGYLALERAVQSHAQIQNAVAQVGIETGLRPWSPALAGPAFDVALSHGDEHVFVVEVKSATAENLEFQLRIGLGQVLRYAHQLCSDAYTVHPVIAIELRPDDSWVSLLQDLGVGLLVRESLPDDLATLMDRTLDNGDVDQAAKETAAQYSTT